MCVFAVWLYFYPIVFTGFCFYSLRLSSLTGLLPYRNKGMWISEAPFLVVC